MSEANQLINNLEQGVDALITKVSNLNKVVKQQEEKLNELTRLSENYKNENVILAENVNRLKLQIQNSNSDSEKIGQYKSRIKELVNEIDSCISLLNG
tara:strand:- start:20 stop:313 length:294 start_codon:yes stop_codon:yes gene_type:complete